MADIRWGATPAEWAAFSELLQDDLWPCVNNGAILAAPSKVHPELDGQPVGKRFSKSPSAINAEGLAYHLTGWTKLGSTERQREHWARCPDLGLGAVCRRLKGIDIDIDDEAAADAMDDAICDLLGTTLPARMRAGSGRRMLVYRLAPGDTGVRIKRVIKTAAGAVEFLFDKQYMALAGVHHSGARQQWPDGIPASLDDVPEITPAQLDELLDMLATEYATSDTPDNAGRLSSLTPDDRRASDAELTADDVLAKVKDAGLYRGMLTGGLIAVHCPWADQHKSTGGGVDPDVTKTVLFPPGVGGFDQWGFKCQHTEGHGHKTFAQFSEALGTVPADFSVIPGAQDPAQDEPMPDFVNPGKGAVKTTMGNVVKALEWAGTDVRLAEDFFLATTLISEAGAKPRRLEDTDYTALQLRIEKTSHIHSIPTAMMREAVAFVANRNGRDSAIEWANKLVWDGEDRLSDLHTRVLGTEDSEYCKAVVRYLFTALAGRCLVPGIKADMTPVLVGRQGVRKSTFIEALAPIPDSYVAINLANRDEDLSRMLRGKLIVESGELRGFTARDEDSLKDWMTRTKETWIPKYKEMTKDFLRRFILIGSTNRPRFLSDPTGARRWLPIMVCETRKFIDTDFVVRHRDQLWAQAVTEFRAGGIQYQRAELLAVTHSARFRTITPRERTITQWLADRTGDGFTTTDIVSNALGIGVAHSQFTQASYETDRIMMALGYDQDDAGRWLVSFL